MKNLKSSIIITALAILFNIVNAQTINPSRLSDTRHIFNASFGMEYGMVYGIGYGYQVKNNLFPMVVGIECSMPSGDRFFQDFKTKIGGQIRLVEYNNFQFTARLQGVFRRYENSFARMLNFGSDFAGIAGYYRRGWFVAGEFGFDKAIVTHFRHTEEYKKDYPGVVDGWYEPSTGGNFYYGLQAGVSIGQQDIFLRAGKMYAQDFRTKPTVPYYGQLGFNVRI